VRPDPPRRVSEDSGFTLLETIVAIGLISTVMAAVSTFMIESLRVTDQQRVKQVAIQLAAGAVDFARNLEPTTLRTGRVPGLVDTTVSGQIPGLTAHLNEMEQLNVPAAGVSALLPLTPATTTVNKVGFTQYWFLGRCWQPAVGGTCTGPPGATGSLQFYRVVVAITWAAKPCGNRPCAYITSTLINSIMTDPKFNTNDSGQPPLIVNPGTLSTDVGIAVNRQMTASGGTTSYSWFSANLPPGLDMGTDGKITGSPDTAGSYLVTITVKDANDLINTTDFLWNINAAPQLAPMTLTTSVGTAVSMTPLLSGGTAPFEWTASGLPFGLSINRETGLITGVADVRDVNKTVTVRINVEDTYDLRSQVDLTWQIVPALVVTVAAQTSTAGSQVNVTTNTATGGSGRYTWSAENLPNGLSIDPASGAVTGRPTAAGPHAVRYTVTDEIGSSTSVTVPWTVV
jgi:prepilin-type N-terminal cleavage/methylation domain-containing protein